MKTILLLGTLLSLTGCIPLIVADALINSGKEKKKKSTSESAIRRPLETTQEDSAHFYRKKQMVTQYDCNGHVVSHSVKTVKKHLSKTFTVDYSGRKKGLEHFHPEPQKRISTRFPFARRGSVHRGSLTHSQSYPCQRRHE